MMNLVKITYTLNGNESFLTFDPSNKLKVFKNIVSLTQKTKLDKYHLFYGKNIINSMDEEEVIRIIGNNPNPVFNFENKNLTPKEREKLSKVSSLPKKNKHKYKVLIQNYPSRAEMNSIINSFIDINFIQDNFQIHNRQSGIEVYFGLKTYALNLIKFLDKEKRLNKIYEKITIYLFENEHLIKEDSLNGSFNNEYVESNSNIKTLSHRMKNSQNDQVKNSHLDTSYLSKSAVRNMKESTPLISNQASLDTSILSKVKDNDIKQKILENYYKNSVYLRNASPYLSQEDKKNIDYKQNKKGWISKDFNKYSGKKYEIIPNYVNLDEFKDSPLNHQFRDINKKKWVARNFII